LPLRDPRSIDQFQRELDLPRWSGGMADNPEAAAANDIRRQPKIDDIENVEKFGAKLEDAEFTISPVSNGRIFDQRNVVLVKTGPAKCVAAQRTEAAEIGAGASRHVDRYEEKRTIV